MMPRVTTATRPRIELAAPSLDERDARAVAEAVASGWVSGTGPYVERFERAFAGFCGASDAVATSNGTTALHLALAALGVGAGDEVIVPSLTFVATANVVRYVGAVPVFADVDPFTWDLAADSVATKMSKRTRAVLPVHLAGQPADIDAIRSAVGPAVRIVEDAAQGIGSTYHGRSVGTLGDAGCFSFFPNKVMTTGEGGMLIPSTADLARRARHLRSHAKLPGTDYVHDDVGFNFRMTSMQAALGRSQLERVHELIAARVRVGKLYRKLLAGSRYTPQSVSPEIEAVPSFFAVVAPSHEVRERAIRAMSDAGIESRPMFAPLHSQRPYATDDRLPVTDDIAARGLLLPCGARVSDADVEDVVRTLP